MRAGEGDAAPMATGFTDGASGALISRRQLTDFDQHPPLRIF